MAINITTFSKIKEDLGYSRWNWIPLLHREVLDNSQSIPYANIPSHLLPAAASQVASETSTCALLAPWGGFADPFTEYFAGGGATGTLLGALSGLQIVSMSFLQKLTARYGLGQEYIGPEIGYCVGTLYKEKVYSLVEARNIVNFNSLITGLDTATTSGATNQFGTSKEQLIWRSKFERFYLNHGSISSFFPIKSSKDKFTITINTKSETTAVDKVDLTSEGDTIKLTNKESGKSQNFAVTEVRGISGGIEIDVQTSSTTLLLFGGNDYFQLSRSWLIQDPYLADGLLREIYQSTIPSGTQEFFKTDQNTFNSEGSVIGVYIRRRNLAIGDEVKVGSKKAIVTEAKEEDSSLPPVTPSTTTEEEVETQRIVKFIDVVYEDKSTDSNINVNIVTPSNEISMPTPSSDIFSDFSHYWSFFPIPSGTNSSEVYINDNRHIITKLTSDSGDIEYREVLMEEADIDDYTDLKDDEILYMRIEISHGGKSTRTNYHDDALLGGFYIQGGNFFEIVGQSGGNIIDVSKKDITTKIDLDPYASPDYILPQEFGWKTVEWYMTDESNTSNLRTSFFGGKVIAKSAKTVKVKVKSENRATSYEQGYYKLGTREKISFYERFAEEYKHDLSSNPRKIYTKFKGWYMFGPNDSKYAIKNIILDSTREDGQDHEIIIELVEEPTDLKANESVHVLFDKSVIPKSGTFDGSYLVDVTEQNSGRADVNVQICLDGFWLGPQFDIPIPKETKMNLCGGRYWGIGARSIDNNNAILFIRTPEAALGLSSMFDSTLNKDFVLYYDYDLKSLSIRKGSVEFREYPMKYEVSIGFASKTERVKSELSASTTKIKLDSEEERVKSLTLNSPAGDELMLFSVGTESNYYGSIISGVGEMDLIGFGYTGLEQEVSKYNYNDQPVSPIYEYKVGKYSSHQSRDVYIGVETSSSPIVISTPDSRVSIPDVEVRYIKDNQIITDARLFDLYQIEDDEFMIFMGMRVNPFTVTNEDSPVTKKSHSTEDDSRWGNSNGIFVIGSKDTGIEWGVPIKKFNKENQYAVLILESANYCCSIHDKVTNEIVILFVGEKDGHLFLGSYIVGIDYLSYKTFKCTSESDDRDFLWRPPAIEEGDVYEKKVLDNYKYDASKEDAYDQIFIIASESDSIEPKTKVDNVTDFGTVSTHITSEGFMIAFYDSLDGVQMIFSKDSGRTWVVSKTVLAHLGKSGFYNGGILFFITSDGVISKTLPESILTSAFKAVEGSSASDIESIQKVFDDQNITSLETGYIPTQKLSVHTDGTGILHIFYYDETGRLSSSEGTDLGWKSTRNF